MLVRSRASTLAEAWVSTLDHPVNLLGVEGLAVLFDVAGFSKLRANFSERGASSRTPGHFIKLLGQAYCVRSNVNVPLSPIWSYLATKAFIRPLSVCRAKKIIEGRSLVEKPLNKATGD